ncbi:MAG: MarR family transcriptional regulator [Clostridiales Family XIII bacterium]|jgi:DNA-binding MarR family transcriptional regulator|nr:MarR family transcriptional regulator [Clostridiales Family XIII bacterium]
MAADLELKREFLHAMFRIKRVAVNLPGGKLCGEQFGVNMAELAVMKGLSAEGMDDTGRHPGLSEIREYLCISKAAISQMLGSLEKKGFITRETDPDNRRRIIVHLTDAGERVLAGVQKDFEEKIDAIIERFGEKNTKQLIRLLLRFSEAVAGGNTPAAGKE